ncbi:hypothetical protein F4776DRAFT_345219 [Hypoxylon sp. NC0597]|nr:hypothetical protein F4776DRAFT_345219 [Hypoxylon sp. NC0597]
MAEDLLSMSPISDGPEFVPAYIKQEQEDIERIIQDDTLDEPAKIDAIAERRGWFRGSPTFIDAFLIGDIDAVTAAETLAKPIDASYSSADYGKALYNAEMTARTQRGYHSPEKALELWGPEEDIPKPGPETDSLPTTEGQLWELWYGVLHAAKRIPWTDTTQQTKLISLVQALQARPNPPLPHRTSVPLLRDWIWEPRSLWPDLVMLGPSLSEAWNDCCGCGAGWTQPEQHAYVNFNAFVARLVATGTKDFAVHGVWALRAALECAPASTAMHRGAPPLVQSRLLVAIAAIWVLIAGEGMWSKRPEGGEGAEEAVPPDRQVDLGAREKKLPWYNKRDGAMWCTARWRFWKGRFEQEADNEELGEETRGLARRAGEIIGGFLEGM